ncbi:hypothetical protein AAMO2058_001570000 [Amorphochlora amoebiformis]
MGIAIISHSFSDTSQKYVIIGCVTKGINSSAENPKCLTSILDMEADEATMASQTPKIPPSTRVAVVGCAHGELDKIYETLVHIKETKNVSVDLLVCCGDFQAVRNPNDLACMACPVKYRKMNTFYKYFKGEKIAPVLTLYVGGNHEASNYHLELAHGGWVAPNIYYMGFANVVNFAGLRIGGISGIYKSNHFRLGHFETLPLDRSSERSCYHVREFEVFRMLQIAKPLDIMVSHDWPQGIYNWGNTQQLLRRKSFLRDEVAVGSLGNPAHTKLLKVLQPKHWFSAHLHVKFPALYKHSESKFTKFLALGKCLPSHDFLQILDIPCSRERNYSLEYDKEWLAILRSTNHLLTTERRQVTLPNRHLGDAKGIRYDFRPTAQELKEIDDRYSAQDNPNAYTIPLNFKPTTKPWDEKAHPHSGRSSGYVENPQSTSFFEKLGISDIISDYLAGKHFVCSPVVQMTTGGPQASGEKTEENARNPEEIEILDSSDDGEKAAGANKQTNGNPEEIEILDSSDD